MKYLLGILIAVACVISWEANNRRQERMQKARAKYAEAVECMRRLQAIADERPR